MPASVSSPAETLSRRAAVHPEDPWLFHRPALDWRWCSWARAARALAAAGTRLSKIEAGTRVALADRLHPDSVVACMALLSRGLTAVPLPQRELERDPEAAALAASCSAWIEGFSEVSDPRALSHGFERLVLPGIPGPFEKAPPPGESLSAPSTEGAIVLRSSEADAAVVSFSQLLGRAGASFSGLPASSGRDIVVLTGSLADPAVQLLLTWSLDSQAAVLLEPDPSAYAPTVEWARPTLLAGTAESLIALHDRLQPKAAPPAGFWRRQRLLMRPLDRLRAVVVLDGGKPAEDAAEAWGRLGLTILASP